MLTIGALGGTIFGGVVATLLHNYPKDITAERSYCTECGMFSERMREHVVLGGQRMQRTYKGMFASLAFTGPPNHEHHWVEPYAHVFPSTHGPPPGTEAALHDALLQSRLQELDNFERAPHYVVLLHEAIKADKKKAEAFMALFLDPRRHYPAAVFELLNRDESWDERWAAIDAFVAAHRCIESPQAVRCTLVNNGKPQVVFEMNAQGAGRRSLPSLRSWKP